MRNFFRLVVGLAAMALLVGGTGQPAEGSAATLDAAITSIASDVVDGVVTDVAYQETSAGVFTVYSVDVADASKGTLSGSVEIAARGGVANDGSTIITSGQPVLSVGDEITAALLSDPTLALPSSTLAIVGGTNGVEITSNSGLGSASAVGDFTLTGGKLATFPSLFEIDGAAPGSPIYNAIAMGVTDWETGTCSTVDFTYNGPAFSPVGLVDGVNAIGPVATGPSETFVAEASLVLAANGDHVEWDVRINFSDHSFAAPGLAGAGTYDIATVVRHEIGEVLGLGTVSVTDEIMFDPVPQATEKFIGAGDESGVNALYPVTIHPFTDVLPGDLHNEAVGWLSLNGITTGTSATTYSPNGTLNRGQAVTFLWRQFGSPLGAPVSGFVDVPAGSFFDLPVDWAASTGVTTGTSPTTFSPNWTLNRAQVVTFLWRAYGSPPVPPATHPYTDVPTASYYTDPVQWAFQIGLLSDIADGSLFIPSEPVSRADMALLLWRAAGSPSVC